VSYSAGVFTINTTGQPVVTGTVISAPVFNAFTADIATGLSTCILKDGTQTATASVPFAQGVTVGSGTTISSTGAITACPSINFGQTALNYYGEGTWTPALGGTTTYNTQIGLYTRIGRLICCSVDMAVNSIGTGSATTISGLPFTVNGAQSGSVGTFSSLATNVLGLWCYATSTIVTFQSLTAANTSPTNQPSIFGSSASIRCSVTFHI